ncbi:pirin family protein [Chitinophaga sp. Cy-1792]|uniref:pirin family protein n=1 Tax=Chitinophaga sp. Cy-1792 TaxID=2608339 RepID=UPI00142015A5|nr:pirin family protein [Chitinophaga sp. Cy-1792]NIG54825.1 pirin family protein [Chitinophaga sp. Cy-1792]
MTRYIFHKEDSRHHEFNEWLDSKKTFSFADYYNPKRMSFGALRVFNDDTVQATKGFGRHPHDNMEIISIPLEGSLIHKDNLGNEKVVKKGEIQLMSTGSGVFHSEYNHEQDKATRFLQIWIYPAQLNNAPAYSQVAINEAKSQHQFSTIVAPEEGPHTARIQQDAWLSIGHFGAGETFRYDIRKKDNGAYVYLISGNIEIDGHNLSAGDALGISDTHSFSGTIKSQDTTILITDVPMNLEK